MPPVAWDAEPKKRYTGIAESAITTHPAAFVRFAELWMIPSKFSRSAISTSVNRSAQDAC